MRDLADINKWMTVVDSRPKRLLNQDFIEDDLNREHSQAMSRIL